MTCVSLRSGIASTGTLFRDQAPTRAAAAVKSRTRYLCLTEKSMMRSSMDH